MKFVAEFEKLIAEYYGAKYAIAVDCCTHAIELCLRLTKPIRVTTPKHTYLSVPMTFEKLHLDWKWDNSNWHDFYYIGNTNIIDAAVYWKKNGYKFGTLMCLSFQYKKHLNVGRGGMILLDNVNQYNTLCKMRYDGRVDNVPWMNQDIDTIGYHYYMTPETAQLGIDRFKEVVEREPRQWSYLDYPDLSDMRIFKDVY